MANKKRKLVAVEVSPEFRFKLMDAMCDAGYIDMTDFLEDMINKYEEEEENE